MYNETLYTISLAKFEKTSDPAGDALISIWNTATGQDA